MKVPKVNLRSKQILPKYSDEELTALVQRVGLTLEQLKLVHDLARATYQYIGYDLQGPNDRETIVEVVLDANYIEQTDQCWHRATPEVKQWLRTKASNYKLDHVYQAVGAGFPYASYE